LTRREARTFPFADAVGLEIDPLFAALRESDPVSRIRLPYGGDGWLLTRYEDNRLLLTDRRFSRAATKGANVPRLTVAPAGGSSLAIMDPPEHSRLRTLVSSAFTARRVKELRPHILQITDELLDELAKQEPPADLVAEFALPLPIRVICELLGVPYADRHRFIGLARVLLSSTAYTGEQVRDAVDELSDYLCELIDEHRARPTDDLLGALVSARDADDRLDEQELVTMCGTLLSAGYENTANSIGNLTYLLLTNPDHFRAVQERPDLIPAAVEEMLRYAMSGLGVSHPRIATEDLEIFGVPIRAGDAVFASLPAANHDPGVFAEPDALDFQREYNPHLAFGGGPHVCLGAQLARAELQVALTSLISRFPALSLAVPAAEIPWKIGLTVRGPESLPVRW
jgi:cytochrome P450